MLIQITMTIEFKHRYNFQWVGLIHLEDLMDIKKTCARLYSHALDFLY